MSMAAGSKVRASDVSRLQYGYVYSETVYYTTNGNFSKGSYAGLQAVRVRVQAAGNAGGGAPATGASQTSGGSGGASGGYAESFLLAASLAATETVTVGTGGTGVSGAAGNEGGDSSFGTLVVADHGDANSVGLSSTVAGTPGLVSGGRGTYTQTGQLTIAGAGGGAGGRLGTTGALGGVGGSSPLGEGGSGNGITTGTGQGQAGKGYGSGGSGSCIGPSNSALAGGAGADGIVIIDIYV